MDHPKTPEDMDAALGMAIRLRRRMIGVTQEQLAEACGVTFQQIQKYENGANRISFSRLVRIAEGLGCRASELVAAVEGDGSSEVVPSPELLKRLRSPAAQDLLDACEQLAPDVQKAVVQFARALARTPQAA